MLIQLVGRVPTYSEPNARECRGCPVYLSGTHPSAPTQRQGRIARKTNPPDVRSPLLATCWYVPITIRLPDTPTHDTMMRRRQRRMAYVHALRQTAHRQPSNRATEQRRSCRAADAERPTNERQPTNDNRRTQPTTDDRQTNVQPANCSFHQPPG